MLFDKYAIIRRNKFPGILVHPEMCPPNNFLVFNHFYVCPTLRSKGKLTFFTVFSAQ